MFNVNFLGLTSQKQNFHKAETAGSIAYKPAETAGSIASVGSSTVGLSGSTPAGCGSSCNVVA